MKSVIAIGYIMDGFSTAPNAEKRKMVPTHREDGLSKTTEYDPLKHFWLWIIHILGVEPLSKLSDGTKLLKKRNFSWKTIKLALLWLKIADAG